MPTFDTPGPILVTLEIGVGDVRIAASDRNDTNVVVRPSDPSKKSDVAAAEQTGVEFSAGRLLIKQPKGWRRYTPRGGGESIDVQIDLPAGSQVRGEAGIAALHCTGPLGECHYSTGVGDIQIDQAGPVHLTTGVGDIAVDRASGHAQISTGSGAVRIGSVDGTAVIKGANGDTWIGDVSRDLRVIAANGSIAVDHSHAAVVAKTANGDVRLGDVEGGTVVAQTALGKVDIGIRDGVAAWLDLNTHFGKVDNELEAAGRPQPGEETVEVRARSSFGDISVRRSGASKTAVGTV
jgi:Putative adhesin